MGRAQGKTARTATVGVRLRSAANRSAPQPAVTVAGLLLRVENSEEDFAARRSTQGQFLSLITAEFGELEKWGGELDTWNRELAERGYGEISGDEVKPAVTYEELSAARTQLLFTLSRILGGGGSLGERGRDVTVFEIAGARLSFVAGLITVEEFLASAAQEYRQAEGRWQEQLINDSDFAAFQAEFLPIVARVVDEALDGPDPWTAAADPWTAAADAAAQAIGGSGPAGPQGPSLPVPSGAGGYELEQAWRQDRARRPDQPLYHEDSRDGVHLSGFSDQVLTSYSGPRHESWRLHRDGPLHREDGPALISTDEDGTRTEHYCTLGRTQREGDGPAVTIIRPDGAHVNAFCKGGLYHREDGPAIIETLPDGSRTEQYYFHGKHPRRDGDLPAVIMTSADGTVRGEKYYSRDGQLHRADAPALIKHFDDGSSLEIYYRQGKRHRADGPALTTISADGTRSEQYFLNGVEYGRESLPQAGAGNHFQAPALS
jgi:hypothetical protein